MAVDGEDEAAEEGVRQRSWAPVWGMALWVWGSETQHILGC